MLADSERREREIGPSFRDVLLPDGQVVSVQLGHVEEGDLHGRAKWFSFWRITGGPAAGKIILRGWNAPKPGRRLSPQHLLYRDFLAVTGLIPPAVPKRCSARGYLGMFCRDVEIEARTRTIKTVIDTVTKKPREPKPQEVYSVIDALLRVTAGCPRILQQRRGVQR